MANPAGLFDEVIQVVDGLVASDGDNALRRARLLHFLRHLNAYIHYAREWEWTFEETAFNVASGKDHAYLVDTEVAPLTIEAGVIPDFLEFGRNGNLYRGQTPMRERTRFIVQRMRRAYGSSGYGNRSDVFAIWGGALQFPFTLSSAESFVAFHRVKADDIIDDDTELRFPDKYTRTVLLPALVWRAMEGKHDIRETWANQFTEGYSQMCGLENPVKTRQRTMPLAMIGVW